MSNFKDLIDAPHRIYSENVNYWNFLLQSYEGGRDYTNAFIVNDPRSESEPTEFLLKADGIALRTDRFKGNLFPHSKETSKDFNTRQRMSFYYNFCLPIIDIYTNHLFKLPILSKYGNIEKQVEQRADDIDLMGSSIDEYRAEKAELAQIYGHIYTLVDTSKTNPEIVSMQDKIDEMAFPFFTLFRPQDIINWALDGFGRPYWVLVRESKDTNIDPHNYIKNEKKQVQYRLWTRTEWILMDSEGEEKERANHELGIVPVNVTYDKRSKKARAFLGVSFINDIVFVARDLYNSLSELRQILRDQTFSFLILQGDAGDYSVQDISTHKAMRYPKDVNAPAFISPDSASAEVYFKHVDRQVDKIFELAMLPVGSASFEGQSAVQESGVSKAWDFHQTNSALSKKASNLEDGEIKDWQMFAAWEDTEFDGVIEYPHDFNVQELIADLTEAKEMMKIGLGKTVNTEIKRAIVKKKFPQKPDTEIDKIVLEFSDTEKGNNALRDKAGSIFKKNAIPGGKNEEEQNV